MRTAFRLLEKVVVVGGSASGASCAVRLRRLDEEAEIVVIEKNDYMSYSSCGMPYYLGEEIVERGKMVVTPIETFQKGFKIDVRNNSEAIEIKRDEKKIVARNTITNEVFECDYDKLVLSMGASPFVPNIKGKDSKHVYTVADLGEMDKIYERTKNAKSCLIIGGGFIGLEVAEQMKERGFEVHLTEITPHLMPPLDEEFGHALNKIFVSNGVNVELNSEVTSIEYKEKTDSLECEIKGNGETKKVDVDFVVVSCGARPRSKIAEDAGLELHEGNKAIVVNENLRTSDENIYASGDLVMLENKLLGGKIYLPLANPANMHGRIIANNIFDAEPKVYDGVIGASMVEVFGKTVAMIGTNEKRLSSTDIPFEKVYTAVPHRPTYMPILCPFNSIKMVFDNVSGQILGVQAIGDKGVDVIANTMALAIKSGNTVFDLESIEFPYCPKSGSAKSPINMLGMMGAGSIRGDRNFISYEEVLGNEDLVIIDVRPPQMIQDQGGVIPHEKLLTVPLGGLRKKIPEIIKDKNTKIVTTCAIGKTAYFAQRCLEQIGYKNVRTLSGGYLVYKSLYDK